MSATATTATAAGRPVVRSITADDVYAALAAGWADFRAAPQFGLFFGGVYAVAGIADPPAALGAGPAVLDRAASPSPSR